MPPARPALTGVRFHFGGAIHRTPPLSLIPPGLRLRGRMAPVDQDFRSWVAGHADERTADFLSARPASTPSTTTPAGSRPPSSGSAPSGCCSPRGHPLASPSAAGETGRRPGAPGARAGRRDPHRRARRRAPRPAGDCRARAAVPGRCSTTTRCAGRAAGRSASTWACASAAAMPGSSPTSRPPAGSSATRRRTPRWRRRREQLVQAQMPIRPTERAEAAEARLERCSTPPSRTGASGSLGGGGR